MPQHDFNRVFRRKQPSYVDGYTLRGILVVSVLLAFFTAIAVKKHFGYGTDTIETIGVLAFAAFFCLLGAGYIALAKLLEKWTRRD
jgi:drug/metabolite transporter (DMT)-like permease